LQQPLQDVVCLLHLGAEAVGGVDAELDPGDLRIRLRSFRRAKPVCKESGSASLVKPRRIGVWKRKVMTPVLAPARLNLERKPQIPVDQEPLCALAT